MTQEEARLAEMLLALKAKAYEGRPWTEDERASVELCFEKGGEIPILGACCILASMRPEEYERSLGIIRETIERNLPLSLYTEESIYEALTSVKNSKIKPFYDPLFHFIEQSLTRRSIGLVNTIFVLGRLARGGETRALALLQSLANDEDLAIRDGASLVLQGLSEE